jgi:hypothetical protein
MITGVSDGHKHVASLPKAGSERASNRSVSVD